MQAIELCIIVSVCVAIVYWLNAPNDIASRVMSIFMRREVRVELRKPLGCATCMTFWLTLAVLLIYAPRLWYVAFVCAWAAKYLHYLIEVIDKLLIKLFSLIDRL